MAIKNNLQALGLSRKEEKVLLALRDGTNTPLLLNRKTDVSRPAVYAILKNLKEKGLADYRTHNGKKYWQMCDEREIDRAIADAKHTLLKIPEGSEAIHGLSDSTVIVHRGVEAVKNTMLTLFSGSREEQFLWGFQGDTATIGWNKTFTVAETNRINRDIKKNGVITVALLPDGWFEDQTRKLGIEWAKDFEGRTTRVNVIDPKYFKHGGQMWVFKGSLYLFSLNEELIVEIRNSEIQKMILSIFEFMQENSHAIDANELLRKLMAEMTLKSDTGR